MLLSLSLSLSLSLLSLSLSLSAQCSIMVLDNGRIVEYDPPGELLTNKKSAFYSMAKDAGLAA